MYKDRSNSWATDFFQQHFCPIYNIFIRRDQSSLLSFFWCGVNLGIVGSFLVEKFWLNYPPAHFSVFFLINREYCFERNFCENYEFSKNIIVTRLGRDLS